MIAPRWRKVGADITRSPLRTILAVLAMAAGVFGISAVLSSRAILTRELASSYSDTRPAAAILRLDSAPDGIVTAVRAMPGVADAELRSVRRFRVRVGQGDWVPLLVYFVRDFRDLRLDRFLHVSGAWPPAAGEMLLEGSALSVARTRVGSSVIVRDDDGVEMAIGVSGIVQDMGLPPAWVEHMVYGFAPWDSPLRDPDGWRDTRLLLSVRDRPFDAAAIRAVARDVAIRLEAGRVHVRRIDVPAPGRHPHADQMDTFLFTLGAFGVLALVLGAILNASLIHALLRRQVRQIGVMKAIGGTTPQIASLYLGHAAALAGMALVLGMPPGYLAARGYAAFAAGILNMRVASNSVPLAVLTLEALAGLIVPLAACLVPVYLASAVSIHDALSRDPEYRPLPRSARRLRLSFVSRPLRLTLRSTLQRPGRLLLAVVSLGLGGAVFIAALSVSAAWTRAIDNDRSSLGYDLEIGLTARQSVDGVTALIAALPDVGRVESWLEVSGRMPAADDPDGVEVGLVGLDPGTPLFVPLIMSGKWIAEGSHGVVISQALAARGGGLRVGGSLSVRIGDREASWPIAGIVKVLDPEPTDLSHARSAAAGVRGVRHGDQPRQDTNPPARPCWGSGCRQCRGEGAEGRRHCGSDSREDPGAPAGARTIS